MKYFAAYALLVLGGNASPSTADIEKVLTAAGVKSDSAKVDELVKALSGKNFHEAVADGLKQMSSMGGSAAPTAAATKEAPKAAAKVEEAPKEEEADIEMGDLFGY